jgi:gliding motility-associated-like protein
MTLILLLQGKMRARILYIIILQILISVSLKGQIDTDPPVSPVLTLVTVNYLTGDVNLIWTLSPSPDVSGYVVYSYRNNEGYPLDTLYNSSVTGYTRYGSGSGYFSESYVVAALDTAGNISPLSNSLNSVFAVSSIDTCTKKLEIKWNSYPSSPRKVLNYTILQSINGSGFTETEPVAADKTSLILNDFPSDVIYCFVIRAILEGGVVSTSNKTCLSTKMQSSPQWINADYATVNADNGILLSFSIDPSSEIKKFILERKTGVQGSFTQIYQFQSVSGSLLYNDSDADISKINYYRLSAVNNCNIPITHSNISSNIVLSIDRNVNDIRLTWNPYKEWRGGLGSYKIFATTGGIMEERYTAGPADTVYNISYSDLMYEITLKEVCFMVKAIESSNPYTVNGESSSSVVCTPVSEVITVPNLFTPDNNGLNDLFRPVLSFTPVDYQLIITDANRKTVFETKDYSQEWDGTRNGDHLPEGLYLWFLRIRTPSGRIVEKSGTITIKLTR